MKYAITTSVIREEIKPFGGCFPVVRESEDSIWIEKTYGVGEFSDREVRRISKKNVRFYSDVDISETIKFYNDSVTDAYNEHISNVKNIISSVTSNYSKKSR
jgi:hypothetical protein